MRPFTALVAVASITAAAVAAAAPPADGDALFGSQRVVPVSITLPGHDWESLRRESRDLVFLFSTEAPAAFTWRRAAATVDGVTTHGVGLRKKGFLGSLDATRPSLIVDYGKFDAASPFAGLGRLTLNNNKQDAACIGQFLAYRLFAAAGVPAPRAGFAALSVNGTRLGVYTIVESIKKPFLRRVLDADDGGLYEGTVADLVPETLGKLEVETHDRFRPTLEALAAMLDGAGPLDGERLGELVDLDTFISYWAVEALAGIWDGYTANQNNYFVHVSAADGRLRFIPWGTDTAFTSPPGSLLSFNRRAPPAIYAEAALPNRLAFTPGFADRYRQRLEELLATIWNEDELLAEVDRVEALLSPHFSSAQAAAPKALAGIREFIRRRRGEVEAVLVDWPPVLPERPRPPLTTKRIGTVSGTFSAWQPLAADEEIEPGQVELTLVLDDETVAFTPADVRAYATPLPGPAARPGALPAPSAAAPDAAGDDRAIGVTIAGRRDDGTPVTITLFLDRRRVRDTVDDVETSGMLAIGGGFFGAGPLRTVVGSVSLSDRGVAPGSRMAGAFSLTVNESRGGFGNDAKRIRPPSARDAATPPGPAVPAGL
ncbi:MAG: hypothetical protein FJ286_02970 [Planctomycetes bacterium]|nr:hypothetical protein [Planctomycetota bacterium]